MQITFKIVRLQYSCVTNTPAATYKGDHGNNHSRAREAEPNDGLDHATSFSRSESSFAVRLHISYFRCGMVFTYCGRAHAPTGISLRHIFSGCHYHVVPVRCSVWLDIGAAMWRSCILLLPHARLIVQHRWKASCAWFLRFCGGDRFVACARYASGQPAIDKGARIKPQIGK